MTALLESPLADGSNADGALIDGARYAPVAPAEAAPLFAFQSRVGTLTGYGRAAALPPGTAATLGERVDAFFRQAGPDARLAGALPFDRESTDCMWQAHRTHGTLPRPDPMHRAPGSWTLRHEPDAAGYASAVESALHIMAAEAGAPDALTKIVLARSLLATADAPIDPVALLRRLANDPAVTAFLVPLPPRAGTPRVLVGATPELLIAKTGASIRSHPLAGSARRQADFAADAAAAARLARSEKDRREHAFLVDFILDTLTPWCRQLARPESTSLTCTHSMWHLGTPIEGELKDPDLPVALLAAALHPTPAVCGVPRVRAAQVISHLEPMDRGFYAGAVGWCDGRGDGAFHVAIRCAELSDATARLYAGAGIVSGSDPWAEADETMAKYGALLTALGIDPKEARA